MFVCHKVLFLGAPGQSENKSKEDSKCFTLNLDDFPGCLSAISVTLLWHKINMVLCLESMCFFNT